MEENQSHFWRWALVFSMILLVGASYVKLPAFRHLVDGKIPWIKEQLAKHGIEFADGPAAAPTAPSADSSSEAPAFVDIPNRPSSAPSGPGKPVDVFKLASDPSKWPKTVTILSPVVFPAVSNGKEKGKVRVPAGTEVQLLRMGGGKLGVVFRADGTDASASGTWVWPEETDLSERLPKSAPATSAPSKK